MRNRIRCGVAFSEIILIVMALVAFSFIVGEIEMVSAISLSPTRTNSEVRLQPGGGAASVVSSGGGSSAAQSATGGAGSGGGGLFGGFLGSLAQGLLTAAFVGGVVYFIASAVGEDDSLAESLGIAVGAGVFTYSFLANTIGFSGLISGAAGLGVGILIFVLLYKEESKEVIQFQCLPYEAPLGGADCDKCNDDEFRPCSDYRCRALGLGCKLVNEGSESEACVWTNPNDVSSPVITPWDEPLTEGHDYANHDQRPPSLGTKIIRNGAANGCIKAFTPLQFGITTNEPAQCKIDTEHTENFESMQFYFGESNYLIEEHTQQLSLPSPQAINAESPEIQNDGIYDFFVRCRDDNGNENIEEYLFSFCVDPSSDTTPPVIIDTSIASMSPVAFEAGKIDLEVYVNEPSDCKWSKQDKNYDEMENSMSCSSSVADINAELLYVCSTTLTGIKDRESNSYYFRCKDQPFKPENDRNVNVQSYSFVLRGTQPLNIIETGPDGVITDSTDIVPVELTVETSNGANEGLAICYFSPNGNEGSYVAMFETNSYAHKQLLQLEPGDYTYYFRCVDAGGNSDEAQTTFTVFVDRMAPQITRAYRDNDALKLSTNENAECSYSLNNCNFNFDEGVLFIYSNPSIKTNHFTPWQPNTDYYIKCRDGYGNQPNPNECSLIATPTNIV
jgi:hypothetical protein